VLLGEAELELQLSSRIAHLQVQQGEAAEHYAERIRAFAAQPDSFEPARLQLEQLAERISLALQRTLIGAVVRREAASVQLIRPEREQIRRFEALPFGDAVTRPEYRPVPTLQRSGPYADPFYYYYYDPYYDFFNFMLIQSMLQQPPWHSHHVNVVSPTGTPLFTGEQTAQHASDGWIGRDAVGFDAQGQVELSHGVDWSAEDKKRSGWLWGSSGGAAGSGCSSYSGSSSSWSETSGPSHASDSTSSCNSSSSDSSGSSCGSSCSGGSCGSSCGGGD
jgi:hypothetical protein